MSIEPLQNIQIYPEEPLTISAREERGLSSAPSKYVAAALIIAAIATALLGVCFPLSIALFAISAWVLWSGVVILANRLAEGTILEKPVAVLHAMANEVNAVLTSAGLFPATCFQNYHKPQGDLKGRPILMINGYLSFGSTWQYQRRELVGNGIGPVYTMNVGSGRSIRTYANHVKEKIKEIQKETGRKDIALVCHSKGGLVGSYFTTELAKEIEAEVTDLITIGSPLAGTPLAYLGPGYDASEMRSMNDFHVDLRNKIDNHLNTRFYHIASATDEVVPQSSALFGKRGDRQLLLKDTGHLGLVYSSRVADQICKWLKN